ncbi:hypothetical protein FRC12_002204 [Ceratobasidium sp. 428]|nr:hypothetical protein FRC12_002204 [Ceratobasidium sp. 428]
MIIHSSAYFKSQALQISNSYEGLSWDGSASDAANNMELKSTSQDVERLIRWSTYLNSHCKCVIKNAAKQDIFSYCFNFLELPFVLKMDDHKNLYWDSSSGGSMTSRTQVGQQAILHFAGAEAGCQVHEFASTGGIFTREFCNVDPRSTSLTRWARQMRDGVTRFIDAYNQVRPSDQGCPPQVPQIYSSRQWDLDDTNICRKLGLCPT